MARYMKRRLLGTTRRQRESRLKSVFALFQSVSQLLPPTYLVKCSRTLQELNSKGPLYGGGGASWCPYHTNVCKICDFVQQYLCSLSSNVDQYSLTVLYRKVKKPWKGLFCSTIAIVMLPSQN